MASVLVEVMAKCVPLIVILGGTGTGKSKLAIEIAKRLGSEIISADSMQVYKGLDILTNKVTAEERAEVPHHLIDFLSPLRNFTVVDFRDKALPIINRLLNSGKPPVVVGGTNYYIEAVVWQLLMEKYRPVDDTGALNERKPETEVRVCEELGFRPMSDKWILKRGVKRKNADRDTEFCDLDVKCVSIFNRLRILFHYPNKILNLLKSVFAKEVNDVKLDNLFKDLVLITSVEDIASKISVFTDSVKDDCEEIDASLFKCVSDLLPLRISVNEISGNLFNKLGICDFNCSENEVLVNNLKEKLKQDGKLNESTLPVLVDAIDNLRRLYEPCVKDFVSVLGVHGEVDEDIQDIMSSQLHEALMKVDPERAVFLHPNDKRKIVRSLEVWVMTGRKHSELLTEQQQQGSMLGGPLRYNNTIIFWLTADSEVLNKRLDERVDKMLEMGLVDELLTFHAEYKPKAECFTKGLFQSIGFKEFREFLFLSDEEKSNDKGKKKLAEGIAYLKLVTKRYVRTQNKWVNNRFLKCPGRKVPPVYKLDTTDVGKWHETVFEPAMDVVNCTINGKPDDSRLKPLLQESNVTVDELKAQRSAQYYCADCERSFVGDLQWYRHLDSVRHKKRVKNLKKFKGEPEKQ